MHALHAARPFHNPTDLRLFNRRGKQLLSALHDHRAVFCKENQLRRKIAKVAHQRRILPPAGDDHAHAARPEIMHNAHNIPGHALFAVKQRAVHIGGNELYHLACSLILS